MVVVVEVRLRFEVKLLWLQDLQHICLYPGFEQYLLSTSMRQKTDLSPLQRTPKRHTNTHTGGTKNIYTQFKKAKNCIESNT